MLVETAVVVYGRLRALLVENAVESGAQETDTVKKYVQPTNQMN